MKVGLLARGEDRGLGIQTWEWARHMAPDRVLLVDMGPLARGFQIHHDRYPGADVATYDDGRFTDATLVREFVAAVDVIYTAETFYDDRLPAWCAAAGTRLVVHLNAEFWRGGPAPFTSWAPTMWRLNTLPAGTRVVSVPVPLDRWPVPAPVREQPVFLHVVGHRAFADRNGTNLLLAAVQQIRTPLRLRLVTQDATLPVPRCHPGVEVERVTGGTDDYWRLYDDADVLVLPRRYGGLCLPANEAAGAGLALVMPDVAPNHRWPIEPVAVAESHEIQVPAGPIAAHSVHVSELARTLQRLAQDDDLRALRQQEARRWATQMAWSEWTETIHAALAE